jgi:hypothetical protein
MGQRKKEKQTRPRVAKENRQNNRLGQKAPEKKS